jgi:hypothetical protein
MSEDFPDNEPAQQAPFDPEHRRSLVADSAISERVIERAKLFCVYEAKAAGKLFGRQPKAFEACLPVLVFPYHLPTRRDPVLYRGKPIKPIELRDPKTGEVRLAKYVSQTKSDVHLYFGPSLLDGKALEDTSIPLLITEGEKKCLSAESHGFACIAISGVDQWHEKGKKTLHRQFSWIRLEGRRVYLCFDLDALENKRVRDNEIALAHQLQRAGAIVSVVRFQRDAGKLDDYLAAHELSEFHALLADADKHGQVEPEHHDTSEAWQETLNRLRVDSERKPIKDVDNIARVLLHHPEWHGVIAFDARRERQTFVKAPPFAEDLVLERASVPRLVEDSDVTRVAAWLVAQRALGWDLAPKSHQIEAAIEVVCQRVRVDGVQDYLRALKWDGAPRLNAMGPTYFGTEDTAYTRAVFSKWMISAVARARDPGCKADHVLVLEGGQGIGKSTALRVLAGDRWFGDTMPAKLERDAHEYCIGPWIIELAELEHMRKSELNQLKAFITLQESDYRAAYGRRKQGHPRRCVFAATTNESAYLNDPTGARRWWPVTCSTINLEALRLDRDQLWAEAVARLRAGEKWHLEDPEERAQAEEQQQRRRAVDPWAEHIARFVGTRKTVTVGDVLDYLGQGPESAGWGSFTRPAGASGGKSRLQHDQRSAQRVAAVLAELGWVRRQLRVNGARVWVYVPPAKAGTSPGQGGVGSGDAEVYDFADESPRHHPSPPDPLGVTGAGAREPARASAAGVHARAAHASSSNSTDDPGDTGDSTRDHSGFLSPPLSPPSDQAGDSGEQLPLTPRKIF